MKKDKLLKIWSKKASGSFKNDIVNDIKNNVLSMSTMLSIKIDSACYNSNDLMKLSKLLKAVKKYNDKINKIVR